MCSDAYVPVMRQGLVGLLMFVFVKQSIAEHVTEIYGSRVKTGLGGNAGNKGAVVVRFKLYETPIVFVNAHLESGKKKKETRVEQMSEILRTPIPGDKQQKYMFATHKLKFFFGDLNFRLCLENEDVRPELDKRSKCNL